MTDFQGWLSQVYWHNTVKTYLVAILIFLICALVMWLFKYFVLKHLKKLALKTKTEIDDVIVDVLNSIDWPFYAIVSFYAASNVLYTPDWFDKVIHYVLIFAVIFYIIKCLQTIVDFGTNKLILQKQDSERESDIVTVNLLSRLIKGILWGIGVVLILQNLGFNVTGLIAGLGIGGLAIAFALQNVLTDIFASISIYLDKPFQIGHSIEIGQDQGVVKNIGLKSTRIQTLRGEELIVSNKELTSTRVHNYKFMDKRRIVFNFGIKYDTPTKKLRKIPAMVSDVVLKQEGASVERVHFQKFGDYSLLYEAVYNVPTSDYNKYMDMQEEINLGILEKFEKEKIVMAFPTQTILLDDKKKR